MTDIAIQEQIDAIRKVTKEALKSKEASLNFLDAADILQPPSTKKDLKSKKK